MNSLQYLNGVSSTSISFTDNRATNVIFDRPIPKDVEFTETASSFPLHIGTEILEIIQPIAANVRFKITMNNENARPIWSVIPENVSLVNVDTIWTMYNITTISEWNTIKQPTITLDQDYFGDASYSVSIIYDTDTEYDKTISYSVQSFVPAAELTTNATLNADVNIIANGISNMFNYFTVKQFIFNEIIAANFYINATGNFHNAVSGATMSSSASLYAKPKLWQFNESTITINKPESADGVQFGNTLFVDPINNYIVASIINDSTYSSFVFNGLTGNLLQSIETTNPNFNGGSYLTGAGNYFVNIQESSTSNDTISLYKISSSGDPYTLVETINLPSHTTGIDQPAMTSNYLVLTDNIGGDVYVYDVDAVDGLTLKYTKTNVTAYPYTALTDDYLCVSNYSGSTADDIYVFETSTGNLLRTITNTVNVNDLFVKGDILYVFTQTTLKSYDLTTGIQDLNVSYAGSIGGIIRDYTSTHMAYSKDNIIDFIRYSDGGIESTVTIGSNNAIPQFDFSGITRLIASDRLADSSNGVVYIRRET